MILQKTTTKRIGELANFHREQRVVLFVGYVCALPSFQRTSWAKKKKKTLKKKEIA